MQAPRRPAALLAGLMLLAAACGDDSDSEEGTPADNVADGRDYCDLIREHYEAEEWTDEEVEAIHQAAPEEIAEDLVFVNEAYEDQGNQAYFDDDVHDRIVKIREYDEQVCGVEIDLGYEVGLPDGFSRELDPDAQQVAVSATEYAFDFEAPEAGPVSFVMTNDGEELHLLTIARIAEGVSLDEAFVGDPVEDGQLEYIVDTEAADPGDEVVLTFEDMEPGRYAMACWVPDDDGTPHADHGMLLEFTVE